MASSSSYLVTFSDELAILVAMTIAESLERVLERIEAACQRARRDSSDVMLIGGTKTVGPEAVVEAYEAGLRDFGENRVQEAVAKIDAVEQLGLSPRWHLIGHLQTKRSFPDYASYPVDLFRVKDAPRATGAIRC